MKKSGRKPANGQNDVKISISDLMEFLLERNRADYQAAPALISLEEIEKRQ